MPAAGEGEARGNARSLFSQPPLGRLPDPQIQELAFLSWMETGPGANVWEEAAFSVSKLFVKIWLLFCDMHGHLSERYLTSQDIKKKVAFPQFLGSRRFLFSKTVLSFVFYTKGSQAVAEFWGFLREWLLLCGWLGALSDEWGSPCWVTLGRHFLLPQMGPVTNLIRQVPDSVTLRSLLNQDPKVS